MFAAIEERELVQITHSIQVERAPSPAMSQGEDCAVGGGGTVPVITAFVEGDVAALDTAFQDQTAEQAQEDCGVSLPPAVDQQQHQDDPAQPGLEAPATSSDAEPAMRLENLRRFESLCSALLRPVNGSRLPVLSAGATCAELAHALREQLGPAVLGDVEDGRDAWQRLADLLAAASGVPVTATLAEKFFPPRLDRPHIPKDVPDYVALHTAGESRLQIPDCMALWEGLYVGCGGSTPALKLPSRLTTRVPPPPLLCRPLPLHLAASTGPTAGSGRQQPAVRGAAA